MEYNPPYGSSDPDAPYVDRNTPGAVVGSKVPAAAIEHPQREIVAVVSKSGLTPDTGDLVQLATAVRSQALNYALAGGTANALTVTLDPPLATYAAGMPLRVLIAATNTSAATLNVNGLGSLPIVTARGNAIARGDLQAGGIVTLICTGTAWMLAGIAYSEVPVVGATTLWVRTDGNDSNDGLSNDTEHALATISEAVARTRSYYGSSMATIRLGNAGVYAAPNSLGALPIPILVQGDTSFPSDYILSGAGVVGASLFHVSNGRAALSGVTLSNTAADYDTASASGTGDLTLSYIRFVNSVANNRAHVWAAGRSQVTVGAGVSHIGTATYAWRAEGGAIIMGGSIASSMSVQSAFAVASQGGLIARAQASFTFSGSATLGARYSAIYNGVIQTYGGGANFFPGAAAGSTSTGGQYG